MKTYVTNIEKKHFYWLADKLGYPAGLLNKVKWNQLNISMIMEEWARKFQISSFFIKVGFCNNDASLNASDHILLEMYFRTVARPAERLPMRMRSFRK